MSRVDRFVNHQLRRKGRNRCMAYLEECRTQIENLDLPRLLQLWEEYCSSETIDASELLEILREVRQSELAQSFGQYVELALPLWQAVDDDRLALEILTEILDLQTTNSPQLADTAYRELNQLYGDQKYFSEKIRLVGLRNRDSFQGCIRNYRLLSHLDKGKFVFHTGGWGTGEVMDYSLVREELVLEFENVGGTKYFSFENAFNHLIPLSSDHILARRFGNPDKLEAEARAKPVEVMHCLLDNLGPLTAAEIKEELCELVIPEEDWSRWWQSTRAKLKKDTMVETPSTMREPFRLRKAEITHSERFQKLLQSKASVARLLPKIYNFARDFPEVLKNEESRISLEEKLKELEQTAHLTLPQKIQLLLFRQQNLDSEKATAEIESLLSETEDIPTLINNIDIVAYKKRALIVLRNFSDEWSKIFAELLCEVKQNALRDYLIKELSSNETQDILRAKLSELLNEPTKYPEAFIWYFQKVIQDESLPYGDKEGQCAFFESLLILLNKLETKVAYRDLCKKVHSILTGKRFATVRAILEGTSVEFVKEFLLLVTKCQTFSDHDIKICQSLAEVVHPDLFGGKSDRESEEIPLWTTPEGYQKLYDEVNRIGTVEIVENAKEIEVARSHGDLRENAEYKFALEKRDRLQSQLKLYSDQLSQARIITEDDILQSEIGVGSKVDLETSDQKVVTYSVLGPWDANPDEGVLSFQSKMAQAMLGYAVGDEFEFSGTPYRVKRIRSYLEA